MIRAPRQARREAGKGDVEEEAKSRAVKLNNSIDQLKDCTTQVLAQVAALAKVIDVNTERLPFFTICFCPFERMSALAGGIAIMHAYTSSSILR